MMRVPKRYKRRDRPILYAVIQFMKIQSSSKTYGKSAVRRMPDVKSILV